MEIQTILVVDDSTMSLKLCRDIYEIAGYKVITAEEGETAFKILREKQIDLVVTDILMPNVDGYMLCYTIRTTEKIKHIPVIIYSATYTSSSDEAMAMEIGADKFIRKPASMTELVSSAKHLLGPTREYVHKIPTAPKSEKATRMYNEGLVQKLEERNVEVEMAKKKLEASETRLKEAQTLAHMGSWELDLTNNMHYWSDEMYNIFGAVKQSFRPSSAIFLSFIDTDDLGFVRRKIESDFAFCTNSFFEFRFVRRDGTVRYGYTRYCFEFEDNGNPLRVTGIVQDITEKKIADEALESIHERLSIHLENTPLGFIEWDSQLGVKSCSRRAQEIFGWSEKEFVDSKKNIYALVCEDDLPWVEKVLQRLMCGEVTSNRIELSTNTKDGRVIACEWFNSVLKDKDGKVYAIMSLVQDISEIKALEKQKEFDRHNIEELTRTKLEKLVEERTHELNVALKTEKEVVEMKNRFVSIASHEFRTPLSTISLAAESIRNYFHKLNADEIKRKLIKIEDQASHMSNLLEDILTIGKSEAGKIKVKRISLDVKEFIEALITEVKASIKQNRNVEFIFSCSYQKINVDDKLLRNIFNNLFTNALKFSAADSTVTVRVTGSRNDLVIEVTDEGIGIEQSELNSIFESFQRGTNAAAIQGTGLGLSILKKAVDLMNGNIEVRSVLHKGSTFKVQIPIQ